jgi:hypothetical protein
MAEFLGKFPETIFEGDLIPTPEYPATAKTWSSFGGNDGLVWLHDTRAWRAHHGRGDVLSANILMADERQDVCRPERRRVPESGISDRRSSHGFAGCPNDAVPI